MAVAIDLAGKSAIVTGGGRGIGRETALLLAKAGACLTIADVDETTASSVAGEIRALDGLCPHQGGYLGQGNVADGRLICPWHAWEFDCRTGENCLDPDQRVPTFPVKVEGADIFLQVP